MGGHRALLEDQSHTGLGKEAPRTEVLAKTAGDQANKQAFTGLPAQLSGDRHRVDFLATSTGFSGIRSRPPRPFSPPTFSPLSQLHPSEPPVKALKQL